jgi:putative ABC transport system permease protein
MIRPPRLAERLLASVLRDAEWRDSILGDLREEFVSLHRRAGRGPAHRWYWRNASAIGARMLTARTALGRRQQSWLSPADAPPSRWNPAMIQDLRYAWRAVRRQPGTSAVIVVTLALALATNCVSFAAMDALVLRPFRFPGVDRVVLVASSDPQQGLLDRESVTYGDFADWRRETRTLTHLTAMEWWDANLSGIEQPEQIPARKVTADFFDALGMPPLIGRGFNRDEEVPGSHRRVVLGHALWTRLFAGDPGVLGRSIRLDGEPYEVIGIAPPGFTIPEGSQLWAPLSHPAEKWTDRSNRWLVVIGRLRDGATLGDAKAEIGAIAERQRRQFPETNRGLPNAVLTFTDGMQDAGAERLISILIAASVLLLLIGCANIANLLLARGSERTQEFGVRLAMGGSRSRLAWQLVCEAGLLSALAVLLAMPLGAIGLGLTRGSIPANIVRFVPGWNALYLSPALFAAIAILGAMATALFAVLPAFHTVRADVADTLRQGARTVTAPRQRYWLRNALTAAQVALTVTLLFGAGLLLAGVNRAANGPTGFASDNLLVARFVLPEGPYEQEERRRQFIDGVLGRLRTIPAISGAAVVNSLPYAGGNMARRFWPEGVSLRESEARFVDYRRVTPEYFATMRIPLLAGRSLTEADRLGAEAVAVVSQSLADRYWPGSPAIGRRFKVSADGPMFTVVGVVGDVLHDWFQQRRAPTVYRPVAQEAPLGFAMVIRTVGEPLSVAGDVRRAVAAEDRDQPILLLQTMAQQIADRTAGIRFISGMLSVVAAIALGLALMGVYSLMAYVVSRRTQELGVRVALGATRWQIVSLMTRQGAGIAAAGLAIGAVLAFAVGRLMESVLFGLVAMSVLQLAALVTLVALVSLLASYLPARRTARLDPTTALRAQ